MEDHTDDKTIRLNDGKRMPLLGLGTWKASAAVAQQAVEAAIAAGYRHIDTAYSYGNEVLLGRAIHAKIKQGIISRKDMFVVSKLWCTYHATSDVQLCLSQSLRNLQLEYLDLYLIHFPVALKRVGNELFPMKDGKLLTTDIDYLDVWRQMEALKASGQVKSIGVSNFNIPQLERLLSAAKVPPAVNQVELHPYLVQHDLIQFCKDRNIALTAYSPIGSPGRSQELVAGCIIMLKDAATIRKYHCHGEVYLVCKNGASDSGQGLVWVLRPLCSNPASSLHHDDSDPEKILEDPLVQSISKKYKRSPAQVLLRYHVQQGISVIPKSIKPNHILENTKIFNFSLHEEDFRALQGLDRGWKAHTLDSMKSHPFYPF